MSIYKVFGPPGTGKTTYLLNTVERHLEQGTLPLSIGYFAFTRKAANEARDRATQKFPHLNEKTDFPWFRTLHSLAYRCLGTSSKDMMSSEDYREFAKVARLDIRVDNSDEEEGFIKTDNPILNEINLARIRGIDLRVHYNQSGLTIPWATFEYVERVYRQFKDIRNLMDFTDLLEKILIEPDRLPALKLLIIDEAQDLSRLQWDVVKELVKRSSTTYIAGDDDQAIYHWAGADVDTFLDLPGENIILDQSYRVPPVIHDLANEITSRIRVRQPKVWQPKSGFEGKVFRYNVFTDVNIANGENWLVLAFTNYFLTPIHGWLLGEGVLFERNGHRSVSETIIRAVLGWEALRKGKEIDFETLAIVYKHLGTDFVKRGNKSLRDADPNAMYSMQKLKDQHGLLTDIIWHEALTKIAEDKRTYIIALLRRGVKLTGDAPVKLSTVHAAKGGEADKVLLRLDLSGRFMEEMEKNPDDMRRLLYVAVTRAKHELHIVEPESYSKGFRL